MGYRADERFPMCSTFKLLLVAAVLRRVDWGEENLNRRVEIAKADLQPTSPGTAPHVGGSMTVAELCEPAIIYSDNTAANLLLRTVGGPSGVTAFARSLGDRITRLDRWETKLNEVPPGDPRDTTTPAAMLGDLDKLLLGPGLTPASRDRLTGWLVANKTGDARLRAGLPKAWRVGDKTGSWLPDGGVNDIGILWPPGRAPVLVCAYTVGSSALLQDRNAVLAEVGRLVAGWA
jgi:beta-lactamase class A